MWAEYDSIPEHDVVFCGGSAHASRGVLLKIHIVSQTRRKVLHSALCRRTCSLLKSLINRLLAAVVIVHKILEIFCST